MKDQEAPRSEERLDKHLSNAREIPWNPEDKWVIYSDLHMGNGGRKDDFKRNSENFNATLKEYYLPRGFKLILNGDVEELHKFIWRQVYTNWKSTYGLFDLFAEDNRLFKTIGNHDTRLIMDLLDSYPYKMDTVLEMTGLDFPLLFYHGHQISAFYEDFNDISRLGLRYLVTPLGIMNKSVAHDSRRRHHLEKRIYEYSRHERIVSVIGHTHRPLFESMNKVQSLRFRLEYLLHQYRDATTEKKAEIEEEIDRIRRNLVALHQRNTRSDLQSGIYAEDDVPLPCVFNSGTVVGKRGMTCLEISEEKIRLVHWYGENQFNEHGTGEPEGSLNGGRVRRRMLRHARMSYVMDSLRLLS